MTRDLDHERPLTVAVRPASALAARPRLFAALEAAFPVSFQPAKPELTGADAAIVICDGASFPGVEALAGERVPVLALGGEQQRSGTVETVRLCDDDPVERSMRGIELVDPLDGPEIPLAGAGERVLAASASGAAWTVTRDTPSIHRVRSTLPELGPDQVLFALLETRAFGLVALVHFLRQLTRATAFEPPPLRAVFLFDDPNLRWRTYGFIDYAKLVEHADVHGYHASMAMIPLDGWRPHSATAELFRERADRLSLVYHGNNHVSQELMRPANGSDALALAAQAMRRVARFESRSGLQVGRVMTPPHGMCSESTAGALAALRFDALCAGHALPWTEHPPADRLLAGWEPAEFSGGCAVIPRSTLTTSTSELAIRAFLGQPLVLYGHHDDLADGLDLLAETAARVNGLGDVRWTSLDDVAATNYAVRMDAEAVRVRPYARRLRLQLQSPRPLIVEAPRDGESMLIGWSAEEDAPVPFNVPVSLASRRIEIRLRAVTEIDATDVSAPAMQLWPVLRRVVTEARDRAVVLRQLGCVAPALATDVKLEWLMGIV